MAQTTQNIYPRPTIMEVKSRADLSDSYSLAEAYQSQPDNLGAMISWIMAAGGGFLKSQSFLSFLSGNIGGTRFINDPQGRYRWQLYMRNVRRIAVVRVADGLEPYGFGGAPIKIVFSEKYFKHSDEIRAVDETQLRIEGDAVEVADGFQYTARVIDPRKEAYIASDQLAAGMTFVKLYSTVSEGSVRGGGIDFAFPYQMENQLSFIRKTYKATTEALNAIYVVEIPNPADPSKKTKIHGTMAEWTMLAQLEREMDIVLLEGKISGANIKDESGFVVQKGAGLYDQISAYNMFYYSGKPTYKFFDEVFLTLSYNAQENGGNHKFVVLTGKIGKRMFSDMILDKVRSIPINIIQEGRFITGQGNELVFTGDQFTRMVLPNGINVDVVEYPLFDDRELNAAINPQTGFPYRSQEFLILNVGTNAEGKTNIEKVALKGREKYMWSVEGGSNYKGETSSSFGVSKGSAFDGCEMHAVAKVGLAVYDPTTVARIQVLR